MHFYQKSFVLFFAARLNQGNSLENIRRASQWWHSRWRHGISRQIDHGNITDLLTGRTAHVDTWEEPVHEDKSKNGHKEQANCHEKAKNRKELPIGHAKGEFWW